MQNGEYNIWVQVFLAYKYLNEFLKDGILKEYEINAYDYFILTNLRVYEDLTFYEINKYMPIDGKSMHKKINNFVEKGLMERQFLENGSSAINLTDKGRDIITRVHNENMELSKDFFKQGELQSFGLNLYNFNEKMRGILELEIGEETIEKINEELF